MSSIEQVRQLGARFWKPLFSALSAALVVVNGLKASGVPLEGVPGIGTTAATKWWLIAAGVAALILVRFPRFTFGISRLILGPPPPPKPGPMIFRGPVPYSTDDKLPGRQKDIDACWLQLQKKPFLVLEGESGCGKSSFLNSLVLPRVRERFDLIECRVSDDPFGKLFAAITGLPYVLGDLALSNIDVMRVLELRAHTNLDVTPADSIKPILVCIDQFEELFATAEEHIQIELLRTLKIAIERLRIHILLAVRSDFLDLLVKACNVVDIDRATLDLGNWYSLKAFREDQAKAVLDEMLALIRPIDPLSDGRIVGFRDALVRQLLRRSRDDRVYKGGEKTVLPVELQTVGMMIEASGEKNFSVAGLKQLGGNLGLLRAFIEEAKMYVWRKTDSRWR